MTVSRQQWTALLEPILNEIRNDQDFPRRAVLYTNLYGKVQTSTKVRETLFNRAGIGDFQEKPEGVEIQKSDPIAGNTIVFTHIRRALSYDITQESFDHDQFAELRKLEMDLQLAADDDLEVRGHLVLNNGFGTTDSGSFLAAGFDALGLFSTAHTRLDGGATQRNRPSTDVNIGWSALADAEIQFALWRDHRGRRVISRPSRVIHSPQDRMTVKELLGSELKPGTANNEINALERLTPMEDPYITSTDDWFVFASGAEIHTIWFWDTTAGTRTDSLDDDKLREITGRKALHGFSHGHGEWFGTYGSSGAA